MKTLDDVLEEYTKDWNEYGYYFDKKINSKPHTRETRRALLITKANCKKYWLRNKIPDDEYLYTTNNSWSEKIVDFICNYNYDFLYSIESNYYSNISRTLKYNFQEAIQRANNLKENKIKKNSLEIALSKLRKEDLLQILLLKNEQLEEVSNRFEKFESKYVFNEIKTKQAGHKMRAYRGLACVILDMDVQTVNKILENVKKNKISLQKALAKGVNNKTNISDKV